MPFGVVISSDYYRCIVLQRKYGRIKKPSHKGALLILKSGAPVLLMVAVYRELEARAVSAPLLLLQ